MREIYQTYQHAGRVPYEQWREDGIETVIFDKDGTLTDANELTLVDEVIKGLKDAQLPDIFPHIAVVSNNHDHEHVKAFAKDLRMTLGVEVLAVSRAQGYKSKPDPMMGQIVATEFGLHPSEIGVVGDRRLTDVAFGRNMGAGAIALCSKAGEGDAKWVPMLRVLESGLVYADRVLGRTGTYSS